MRRRTLMKHRHKCAVYDGARSAIPAMAEIAGVELDRAWEMLTALVKAGFVIAPREPSNGMLSAYMEALNEPARNRDVVIQNIGKARRRWVAMGTAGTKLALSRRGLEQESDSEASD